MSVLNCPACSSDQTQRLSAIVDGGTSHTRGSTVGGFSGVGIGAGGAAGFGGMSHSVTNSVTKSTLATKLSAPARRPEKRLYAIGAVLVLLSFSLFHLFFLLGLLFMAGGGLLIYKGTKNGAYNRTELPGQKARWSSSFYCHRCQNVYLPVGFAQATSGPVIEANGAQSNLPGEGVSNRLQ